MSPTQRREFRNLIRGLAFLSPNITGFLVFTLVPLVLSFVMAFTNWDLQQHNRFGNESIEFIGLANFERLVVDPQFWRYLGNTFFLMLVIPFGIAGSLGAALLLQGGARSMHHVPFAHLAASAVLVAACLGLTTFGMGASALMLLISGLFGLVLMGGVAGSTTTYRTLFYLPHFTQGVAVFLLWKKLYNPTSGPINMGLEPVLTGIEAVGQRLPASFGPLGLALCLAVTAAIWLWMFAAQWRAWHEGESGTLSLLFGQLALGVPLFAAWHWLPGLWWVVVYGSLILVGGCAVAVRCVRRRLVTCSADHAVGTAMLLGGLAVCAQLLALGGGLLLYGLPAASQAGLQPPQWLADYHWAKPSLMMISLWAAIGSNNMILYLAGLSNIPVELYEAAEIDGAGRFRKFAHITWPQLAPVTFFIVVMSFIYGLQGGFEMARTMTGGGPAGATTTLSYYIYAEGFETGRLGYASAVAWVLFLIVFAATIVNWRFGNRYVAD
jgi:multiple sugar transport system permease protein